MKPHVIAILFSLNPYACVTSTCSYFDNSYELIDWFLFNLVECTNIYWQCNASESERGHDRYLNWLIGYFMKSSPNNMVTFIE